MMKKHFFIAVLLTHITVPSTHALTPQQYAAGGTAAALLTAAASGAAWGLKRRARLRRVEQLRRKYIQRAAQLGHVHSKAHHIKLAPGVMERLAPYLLAVALLGAGVGGTTWYRLKHPSMPPNQPQDPPHSPALVGGHSRADGVPQAEPLPLSGPLRADSTYMLQGRRYTYLDLGEEGLFLEPVDDGDIISLEDARAIAAADQSHDHARTIQSWPNLLLLKVGDEILFNSKRWLAMAADDTTRIARFVASDGTIMTAEQMWQHFAPERPTRELILPVSALAYVQDDQFILFGPSGGRQVVCKVLSFQGRKLLYPVKNEQEVPTLLSDALNHAISNGWIQNPAGGGTGGGTAVPVHADDTSALSHVRSLEPNMIISAAQEMQQLSPGELIVVKVLAPRHPGTGASEGEDQTYGYVVGEKRDDGYHQLTPIDQRSPEFANTRVLFNHTNSQSNMSITFKGVAGPGRFNNTAILVHNDIRLALPIVLNQIHRFTGEAIKGRIVADGGLLTFVSEDSSTSTPLTPSIFRVFAFVPVTTGESYSVDDSVEYLRQHASWLKHNKYGVALTIEGEHFFFLPSQTIRNRSGEQMLFTVTREGQLQPAGTLASFRGKKRGEDIRILDAQEVAGLV